MKRVLIIVLAFVTFALPAVAQSAKEIVDRMNQELNKGDEQGTAMTMDMTFPILGQFSTSIKSLGKMSRADMDVKGEKGIVWIVNALTVPKDGGLLSVALVFPRHIVRGILPCRKDSPLCAVRTFLSGNGRTPPRRDCPPRHVPTC